MISPSLRPPRFAFTTILRFVGYRSVAVTTPHLGSSESASSGHSKQASLHNSSPPKTPPQLVLFPNSDCGRPAPVFRTPRPVRCDQRSATILEPIQRIEALMVPRFRCPYTSDSTTRLQTWVRALRVYDPGVGSSLPHFVTNYIVPPMNIGDSTYGVTHTP